MIASCACGVAVACSGLLKIKFLAAPIGAASRPPVSEGVDGFLEAVWQSSVTQVRRTPLIAELLGYGLATTTLFYGSPACAPRLCDPPRDQRFEKSHE